MFYFKRGVSVSAGWQLHEPSKCGDMEEKAREMTDTMDWFRGKS
jgi:hypothetical protein